MYAKILICNRSLEYYNVLLMPVIREGGRIFDRYQLNAVTGFIYLYLWPE